MASAIFPRLVRRLLRPIAVSGPWGAALPTIFSRFSHESSHPSHPTPARAPHGSSEGSGPIIITQHGDHLGAKLAADVDLGAKPDENKSEVKDAKLIFEINWGQLVSRIGLDKMSFPREIVWLSGAPGAGKGTVGGFILKERDIPALFEVSSLLQSPEMKRRKEAGALIGDREVMMAVLEELVKPQYAHGVVVDGFPRTVVQAESIKLLYDKLMELWHGSRTNPLLKDIIRRPNFSICVLYVDETESVKRQLKRGLTLEKMNRMVADTGVGNLMQVRATDSSEEAARKRYKIFKDEVYAALQSIKDRFLFHFIQADGSPDEVASRIRHEFAYQASQDLGPEAFELMRSVEPASAIIRSARSNMVLRLNHYATDFKPLFISTLDMINAEMMHIIKRQGLMGHAVVRSQNPSLDNPVVINMVLDVLAERGFTVALDVVKTRVPALVEAQVPGSAAGAQIVSRVERTYVFRVDFPKPEIRRNE